MCCVDSVFVAADDGVSLHVAVCGQGADVVVLSGGPGCVHYLADESLAPNGFRCWFPDPRGVSRSGGGPHDMATAVADLEAIRRVTGVESWIVLGHSWGSDLAVRYALEPGCVTTDCHLSVQQSHVAETTVSATPHASECASAKRHWQVVSCGRQSPKTSA